jgi:hypothetical protein
MASEGQDIFALALCATEKARDVLGSNGFGS